jgi:regulator of protease activity HflC (stomatin/prohibitin superfamily)
MMHLQLKLNQRAILIRNGVPERALEPGRYTFWRTYDVLHWNTDELAFSAPAAVLAAMPATWFTKVDIPAGRYGIVERGGRAVMFLRPGSHRIWKVEADVQERVFDETVPLPELTDELRKAIPANELVEAHVDLTTRAVLLREGVPERVLGPGHHAFWGKHLKLLTWNVDDLVFTAPQDVVDKLPSPWFTTVILGALQRAVIERDGRPLKFLRPGLHRVWTVNPNVKVTIYEVADKAPELTDELRAVVPAAEIVEAQVRQYERGLKYVQGTFEGMLEPGRYAFWNHPGSRVAVTVIDTRVQQLKIEGQELMTRDKVTLRLTLTAEYAPSDASMTQHSVADVKEALYLAVQLAAREYVSGVTLDELLEARDNLTRYLETQVVPRAELFGVRVQRVGVKDVILPGDMKTLLNKVIEAEKAAAANVILRREDAAATRNMANTAKVIAENPVLMRLKELETMKDMAEKIDEIKLVMGADGLRNLLPFANGTKEH